MTIPVRRKILLSDFADGAGADDGVGLQKAVDHLESIGGGTVYADRHEWNLDSRVQIKDHVNLWGESGGHLSGQGKGTVFNCRTDVAGIEWPDIGSLAGNRGGISGNFILAGNDVSINPLYLDVAVQRSFSNIDVLDSVGDGIVIERAQNNVFTNVNSERSANCNLTMDRGAGGNHFAGCEFSTAAKWNLEIRQTAGDTIYNVPTHNTFDTCIFERGDGEGSVHILDGQRNTLRDCVLSKSGFIANTALLLVEGGQTIVDNSWFHGGDNPIPAIRQNSGGLYVYGFPRIQNVTDAWEYNSGFGKIAGHILYSAGVNEWSGSGVPTSRPNPSWSSTTQNGVPVTAAGIHAALVSLGLIT